MLSILILQLKVQLSYLLLLFGCVNGSFFIPWCLHNDFRRAGLEVHMNLQEALLDILPEFIDFLR